MPCVHTPSRDRKNGVGTVPRMGTVQKRRSPDAPTARVRRVVWMTPKNGANGWIKQNLLPRIRFCSSRVSDFFAPTYQVSDL